MNKPGHIGFIVYAIIFKRVPSSQILLTNICSDVKLYLHAKELTAGRNLMNGNRQLMEEKLGKGVEFERIRRITGYLVGSMNQWNNAKKAEEKDRVKHL